VTDRSVSEESIDKRTWRELTQLADGTLSGAKRDAVEARVSSSPELAAALERQRAAIDAMRGLDMAAPARLRARIASQRERPRAWLPRRRLSIAGGLATAMAAALAAILILPSDSGGPSVVDAAQLSTRPATQASVPVDRADPKLLAAASDGIPFPNFERKFGWREAGLRGDDLEGRQTKTVFYRRGSRRIGYTIIAGGAIPWPSGARRTKLNGVALRSTADDSLQIVTWRRNGRTCVLSGKGVSAAQLLALASWKGEGSVAF